MLALFRPAPRELAVAVDDLDSGRFEAVGSLAPEFPSCAIAALLVWSFQVKSHLASTLKAIAFGWQRWIFSSSKTRARWPRTRSWDPETIPSSSRTSRRPICLAPFAKGHVARRANCPSSSNIKVSLWAKTRRRWRQTPAAASRWTPGPTLVQGTMISLAPPNRPRPSRRR